MDTDALASSLFPESEDTSESFSEEEEVTAESGPAHSGPAKCEIGKGSVLWLGKTQNRGGVYPRMEKQ